MARPKRSGILTGTAGVYFVASRLAAKGFHAAPTFGNAPNVDILVGLPDGKATASIQVKTSWWGLRTRGRGKNKQPHHYEWDVGKKSANLNRAGLFFAFVDLRGGGNELPDVFIVPSEAIFKAFDSGYFKSDIERRWRWHPTCAEVADYKNRWDLLEAYLRGNDRSCYDSTQA